MTLKLKLPWWWRLIAGYLTLWSIAFSLWNLLDGQGMMVAFGVDTGGASEFIMLNSAARYVAIAIGMVVGIWVFGTYHSILTALTVRLVMDLLDLYAGLQAGIIEDATGVIQSLAMFLVPNVVAITMLRKFHKKLQCTQSASV
ncbi:MAG: hypothetical protein AAGA85_25660 [Bacteroidota bacterium]